MANRPVFIATGDRTRLVEVRSVGFEWSSGLSVAQKRRCISALHAASGFRDDILEVSSKSSLALGQALSAFRLPVELADGRCKPLESVYQSAKVFATAGPFPHVTDLPPVAARKALQPHADDRLTKFQLGGRDWPLQPTTAFYDWLYCNALRRQPGLVAQLQHFRAFTDIEFNPARSFSCQAGAVALYLSLQHAGLLRQALQCPQDFLATAYAAKEPAAGGGQLMLEL